MIKQFAVLAAAAMCTMAFANVAAADEDDNPDWSKQQQQAAGSSGLGESCRRKTDCKEGLKCVKRVCTDPHEGETCGATADCGGGELKCINDKCTSPNASSSSGKPAKPEGKGGDEGDNTAKPAAAAPGDWLGFRLDDGQTHPFIGITGPLAGFGMVGLDLLGTTNFFPVNGAFLFALKAGIIVGGHHELGVEITPFFTAVPFAALGPAGAAGPVFEMNVSYGYLIPIMDHLSWPLRLGAGIMAGPSPNAGDDAWFEVRADLVGVQINVGHVLVDLHLPSFRYFVTSANGTTLHSLDWLFGLSLGYAL
jgi:hypothetical protein